MVCTEQQSVRKEEEVNSAPKHWLVLAQCHTHYKSRVHSHLAVLTLPAHLYVSSQRVQA